MNERSIKEFLLRQCASYPALTLQDLFKVLYQSCFGGEHLVADMDAAADGIRREAAGRAENECVETLAGGRYARVDLGWISHGMRPETLARLFIRAAGHEANGAEWLEEALTVLTAMGKGGELPFSAAETAAAVTAWRHSGFPPLHHSEAFRAHYAPAYRLVRGRDAHYLPLFARLDRALAGGERVILAIEGGSASGKTTLAALLQEVYGCPAFHMDDFFLRPEQRTAARLAEAGGNVDHERFLQEVLLPLVRNETVAYRRYDCVEGALLPPRRIKPGRLNVVEGAYSMHPLLAPHYTLSAFLDIAPQTQRARIAVRNAPELAARFVSEWIPLEEAYFQATGARARCALIFRAEDECGGADAPLPQETPKNR